jgi:hypothetical protein
VIAETAVKEREAALDQLSAAQARIAELESHNAKMLCASNYMLDILDVVQFRDAANMRLHEGHPAYEKLQLSIAATERKETP